MRLAIETISPITPPAQPIRKLLPSSYTCSLLPPCGMVGPAQLGLRECDFGLWSQAWMQLVVVADCMPLEDMRKTILDR